MEILESRYGGAEVLEILLSYLYCTTAIFFLALFGLDALLRGASAYGLTLLGFGCLTVGSVIYIDRTRRYRIVNHFILSLLGMLCLFLYYTGGVGGTGPLWYYTFPLFALFILGQRAGVIAIVLLLAITLAMNWLPPPGFDPDIYTEPQRQRFIAVFITVSLMASLFQHFRSSAQKKLTRVNADLQRLAHKDGLTDLANRRHAQELLQSEINRARRDQSALALILFDLDHFKDINDNRGHACGDSVLHRVSEVLRRSIRSYDTAGRWGGEEFIVILPNTSLRDAEAVAERIRHAIGAFEFEYEGGRFKVTASFGVAQLKPNENLTQALNNADNNLYLAKSQGRNRVVAATAH